MHLIYSTLLCYLGYLTPYAECTSYCNVKENIWQNCVKYNERELKVEFPALIRLALGCKWGWTTLHLLDCKAKHNDTFRHTNIMFTDFKSARFMKTPNKNKAICFEKSIQTHYAINIQYEYFKYIYTHTCDMFGSNSFTMFQYKHVQHRVTRVSFTLRHEVLLLQLQT